jgi:protein-S-isoprenylcysteine O-methyltransferase Ste14
LISFEGDYVGKQSMQQSMYDLRETSSAPKIFQVGSITLWVVLSWWLLLHGGLAHLGAHFGHTWPHGNLLRRDCLLAAFSIYCIRLYFTTFVFLKRGVTWGGAITVSLWVLFIFMTMSIGGGIHAAPFGTGAILGILLFVFGSWMNSWAEYQRHAWKRNPDNKGKLYTQGLFRISMHPNYLGDVILFSGISLIAGTWFTVAIPVIMFLGFVFANIPMLDSHLHDHYGAAFDDYAKRTSKLIPYIY